MAQAEYKVPDFPTELKAPDHVNSLAMAVYAGWCNDEGQFDLPMEKRLGLMWNTALILADQLMLARGVELSDYVKELRKFGYIQLNELAAEIYKDEPTAAA